MIADFIEAMAILGFCVGVFILAVLIRTPV